MTPTRSRPLTIVADDLTGACDAGALFTGRASVPVTVWPRRAAADAAVRVVDTETRRAHHGGGGRARGHRRQRRTGRPPLQEDRLHAARPDRRRSRRAHARHRCGTAIVCPAFPAQGRVVLDRVCLVNGVPVADTPIGRGPAVPRPELERGGDAATAVRPRPVLDPDRSAAHRRRGARRADRPSGRHGDRRRRRDRRRPRRARRSRAAPPRPRRCSPALRASPARSPRGSACCPSASSCPPAPRWLLVAGSVQPATRRQIKEARAAGLTVLATPERRAPIRRRRSRAWPRRPWRRSTEERWDLVAVTGGETAVALWSALGADRIDLLGVPAPGLALGHLRVRGARAAHRCSPRRAGSARPISSSRSRRRPWREVSRCSA